MTTTKHFIKFCACLGTHKSKMRMHTLYRVCVLTTVVNQYLKILQSSELWLRRYWQNEIDFLSIFATFIEMHFFWMSIYFFSKVQNIRGTYMTLPPKLALKSILGKIYRGIENNASIERPWSNETIKDDSLAPVLLKNRPPGSPN